MKKPVKPFSLIKTFLIMLPFSGAVMAEIAKSPVASFQIPPAPRIDERGEPPAWNYAWVEGYWNWESDDWVWHPGRYKPTVRDRPPIKNQEFVGPPPSQQHTWIPGYWVYEHGDWSWHKGQYRLKPFSNAFWHTGYWRYQAPGWVWVDGHW